MLVGVGIVMVELPVGEQTKLADVVMGMMVVVFC